MSTNIEIIAKIVSPLIVAIVSAIINLYLERRSKLISYLGHVSSFTLKNEEKTQVYTHSIVIRNAGRKAAKNVRIGHNVLPQDIQIFPPINYSIINNPSGAAEILIPVLVPTEQITISYLYFPPLTWDRINAYAKSDEGFAKIINAIPTPRPSKWVVGLLWLLIFVGASSLVYWGIKLIAELL